VKEHLQGKWFESEDINIAFTASFHHLSKAECRAATDSNGKSVWTLMVVTLCKGHICSVVILYFVITVKSCTKHLK
jgi:hypothetical protein